MFLFFLSIFFCRRHCPPEVFGFSEHNAKVYHKDVISDFAVMILVDMSSGQGYKNTKNLLGLLKRSKNFQRES